MPKLTAPHAAAWRGCALEIAHDGTVDVPDDAVAELVAHGFREIDDAPAEPRVDEDRIASMSRKELIAFIRANGGGNPITLSTAALREAARKTLNPAGY